MIRKYTLLFILLFTSMTCRAITYDSAKYISEAARASARQLLQDRPERTLARVANTKSMLPTFGADYLLVLEPRPYDSLDYEDIVIFTAEWAPGMVVHRLYYHLRNGGWLTKGDNVTNPDPTVLNRSNYGGAVIVAAIHRLTGRIVTALTKY